MTKYEFLRIIEEGLKDFPPKELQDILYDYEEHFNNGRADGKTDQQIISELGDPYSIINQYRNGYLQKNTKYTNPNNTNDAGNKILKIIIIILSIIVFTPVTFGFGGGLIGLIFGLRGAVIGIGVAGLAVIFSKFGLNIIGITVPSMLNDLPTPAAILFSIGSIFGLIFAILVLISVIKLIIHLVRKLINYIQSKGVL